MKKIKLNSSGFTLVELLVGLVILGIVLTAIYSFMQTSRNYQKSLQIESDYQSITTALMQKTRVELANAMDIHVIDRDSLDLNQLENPSNTDEYNYIVSSDDGSLMLYAYKTGLGRQPAVKLAPEENTTSDNYKSLVTFKADGDGKLWISAVIERTDNTDDAGNHIQPYAQSTSISYDTTLDTSGGYQRAVKYKLIE